MNRWPLRTVEIVGMYERMNGNEGNGRTNGRTNGRNRNRTGRT